MIDERIAELEAEVERLRAEVQHLLTGPLPEQVQRVYRAWVEATGRDPKRTKLTRERAAKIKARLRERQVEDLIEAVLGGAAGAHRSDSGIVYDDITTLLQSNSKVELNMERYDRLVRRRPGRGRDSSIERKLLG